MKLDSDFGDLERALRKMGAEPVEFDPHVTMPVRDPFEVELERGIELPDLKDVESTGGLLTYKGRQILLYIRDHAGKVYQALEDGKNGNRFHVAECRTLERMRRQGRFERYVVTNKLDGWFHIAGNDWKTGLQAKGDARLWVCQNCLKELNYKGARHTGANMVARDFDIGEFFSKYSSFFKYLPNRRAEDGDDENYTQDWRHISSEYKGGRHYICEACGVDLSSHQQLLHVHHINGVKSDNSPTNLRALCVSCHREQPAHGHMFVSHQDTQRINHLRRQQGLIQPTNWDVAFRYCDPALQGVLDACKRQGCPVPEIGLDIKDAKGKVVAELEIAWERARVGVAISAEDRQGAEHAGWDLLLPEDIIRYTDELNERLRSRRW